MDKTLLLQFISLVLYASFMGFTFCDGFKLHTARKLIWFAAFLARCMHILRIRGEYDLPLILPLPTLLAIFLCLYEKIKSKIKPA